MLTKRAHKVAIRSKHLNTKIALVRNVHQSIMTQRNSIRAIELRNRTATCTPFAYEPALRIKHLNAMVVAIHNIENAAMIVRMARTRYSGGSEKLTVDVCVMTPRVQS